MSIHFTPIHKDIRKSGRYGQVAIGAHAALSWRIHKIAPDFSAEDVWALPTPGGPDDFPLLLETLASGGPEEGQTALGRFLFALRWKLGKWLGWDKKDNAAVLSDLSLQQRLPADLRATNPPASKDKPFRPLYVTKNEYASEIINSTMHGILHLGWVRDGAGGYQGQMAVLVKPNGLLGKFYMALIKPFRYLIIYPALMRKIDRKWRAMQARSGSA